ncbi:hypothetical protein PYCCODRAFT_1473601 [Trametes coccinea BRFM310]|uniref:Uncharacterized protein n=1 Tax=Trametes coccinea (strain BRFM310) TaxID=1353009 RepID=A0A1Y2J5C5_TRAC3|nr:hypothetical protein PYCCODRAFT_1473601 [Trametes coccinea BRFM310]
MEDRVDGWNAGGMAMYGGVFDRLAGFLVLRVLPQIFLARPPIQSRSSIPPSQRAAGAISPDLVASNSLAPYLTAPAPAPAAPPDAPVYCYSPPPYDSSAITSCATAAATSSADASTDGLSAITGIHPAPARSLNQSPCQPHTVGQRASLPEPPFQGYPRRPPLGTR